MTSAPTTQPSSRATCWRPRRSADEIARLEVLHVVVRDAAIAMMMDVVKMAVAVANFLTTRHGEDAEGRAERVHDERSHDDGEDADARDRTRARADEAGHVSAGCGDEEAHEDGNADANKVNVRFSDTGRPSGLTNA